MPPVALKFVVSAPGKVILFGEHSVLYGKPAVAAAINKRSTLLFESSDNDAIDVVLSALNLSLSVPLNVVRKILEKFAPNNGDARSLFGDRRVPYCDRTLEGVENYELLQRNQKVSLFCLFYLLRRFCSASEEASVNAFKIRVSSDLAVGAGTGSSASYCVCLAAALYHYFRASQNISDGATKKVQFSSEDKRIINDYAFACEQIIHGQASGVDNFVCTYGSIIEVVSSDDEKNLKIFRALDNVSMLRIFLINTGIDRSTAKMVQNVRDFYSRNSTVMDAIFEAMGAIVKSACSTLAELKKNEQDTCGTIYAAQFEKLEDLISLNHGLLATLGVSHSSLDTIVNITKKYNLHSKLTGAGGGGFAFTLIPPYRPNDVILNCKHELENSGFVVDDIIVGSKGVDIEIL